MALLWDHICHPLILILLCIGLAGRPCVIHLRSCVGKRFRDDIFSVWKNSLQELHKFFKFMNSIDTSGKIEFTMSIASNYSVLEFLDLSLHINEHNKICVDVYAKPTNSFTYVLPSTCYPKKCIKKVPKGIALRL